MKLEVDEEGVNVPQLLTEQEWRRLSKARRRWNRRVSLATVAVLVAEVAAAVAWTSWTQALATPQPKVGS